MSRPSPARVSQPCLAKAAGKSKRAGKFKLKRRGEPWEVRIVTADGREQTYRGYRERGPRRDTNHAPGSVREGDDRRESAGDASATAGFTVKQLCRDTAPA